MNERTVTKGEFAAMIGKSAGRISQMISAGQITRASLDGSGRSARIIVDQAIKDLKQNLDPSQSFGLNGMDTRMALSSHAPDAAPGDADTGTLELERPAPQQPMAARQPDKLDQAEQPSLPIDRTADLIGREKLRQAQLATLKMERQEALEEGRFVLADEARAAIGAAASKLLATFESGLSDMADAMASKFGLPPRDVLHVLTHSFRDVREAASKSFADQRDAILAAEAEAIAKAEAEQQDPDTE